MKYSNNPSDWFFYVIDGDIKCIALSEDSSMLDDQLGSYNLPKPIRKLLEPYFFMDSELAESCFEMREECELTCSEVTQILTNLGFKESGILFGG